jgi:hypothetical protein
MPRDVFRKIDASEAATAFYVALRRATSENPNCHSKARN